MCVGPSLASLMSGKSGSRSISPSGLAVVAIVVIVAFFLYLHVAYGLQAVVVDGISMLPTLQSGDVVFIVHVNPTDINVGDVIVYRFTGNFYGIYLSNALIIHRVIYKYYYNGVLCFVTKGDNNPLPDPGYPSLCGTVDANGTEVSGIPYYYVYGVVVGGSQPLVIPYVGGLSLMFNPSSVQP